MPAGPGEGGALETIFKQLGNNCGSVEKLNLKKCGLKELDASLINKLTSIKSLVISGNKLRKIPDDLVLPSLHTLDCSDNLITDLSFVKSLTNLKQLITTGNGLEPSDKYIATALCPGLQVVDGTRTSSFSRIVNNQRAKLEPQLRGYWEACEESTRFKNGIPAVLFDSVLRDFIEFAQKKRVEQKHSNEDPKLLRKLRDFMITEGATKLLTEIKKGDYKYCRKRKRSEKEGNSEDEDKKEEKGKETLSTYSSKRRRVKEGEEKGAGEGTQGGEEAAQEETNCDGSSSPRKQADTEGSNEEDELKIAKNKKVPIKEENQNCEEIKGKISKDTSPQKSVKQDKESVDEKREKIITPKTRGRPKKVDTIASPKKAGTPKKESNSSKQPLNSLRRTPKKEGGSGENGTKEKETNDKNSPRKKLAAKSEESEEVVTSKKKATPKKDLKLTSPKMISVKKKTTVIDRLPSMPDYDPMYFLRCHSENDDPTHADAKVWRCEFEPGKSNIVATCGGDLVCLIDCSTGKLLKRYKKPEEELYAIAWTTLKMKTKTKSFDFNILAVGGKHGVIYLLHPDQLVCYNEQKAHNAHINCLMFHPNSPTQLFSASGNDFVIMWDIGIPSFPDYTTKMRKLMTFRCDGGDMLNLIYSPKFDALLAGCECGCFLWNKKRMEGPSKDIRTPSHEIMLPDFRPEADDDIIDGLVMAGEDLIATKVSMRGTICLWRLSEVVESRKKVVNVTPIVQLQWQVTNQLYLNLGVNLDAGMLFCGDSNGAIWTYNIKPFQKPKVQAEGILKPSRMLAWPECHLEKEDQAMEDVLDKEKEIIINTLVTSKDHHYIVAGSDNNLVCIWKKV